MSSVLNNHFQTTFLGDYLKRILNDSQMLEQVRTNTHLHPFQFTKMVLIKCDDGSHTRLHIWHKPPPVETPHNHGWDFTSCVLTGALRNTKYSRLTDATDTGDIVMDEYHMDLSIDDKQYHLQCHKSHVPLAISSQITYNSGQQYFQTYDELHSSHPTESGTITLVKVGPLKSTSNIVFKDHNYIPPPPLETYPSISREELVTQINIVLQTTPKELLQMSIHELCDYV